MIRPQNGVVSNKMIWWVNLISVFVGDRQPARSISGHFRCRISLPFQPISPFSLAVTQQHAKKASICMILNICLVKGKIIYTNPFICSKILSRTLEIQQSINSSIYSNLITFVYINILFLRVPILKLVNFSILTSKLSIFLGKSHT